jgi:uncharacterized YccA/Bax inhibitor family protein
MKYSIVLNIFLVMFIVGFVFITDNFLLAAGLTIVGAIGTVMTSLLFFNEHAEIIFKIIKSWLSKLR